MLLQITVFLSLRFWIADFSISGRVNRRSNGMTGTEGVMCANFVSRLFATIPSRRTPYRVCLPVSSPDPSILAGFGPSDGTLPAKLRLPDTHIGVALNSGGSAAND